MNRKQWIVTSILIPFLFLIVILPNMHSILHKAYGKTFIPLTNSISITFLWQFFSPEPAKNSSFHFNMLKDNHSITSFDYPNTSGAFLFRSNYSRRLSLKNIMHKYPNYIYSVIVPYFCKQYPQANYIKISRSMVPPANLQEVRLGHIGIFDDSKIIREDLGYEACENDI